MSPETKHAGHIGHLTAEQERKLLQFWLAIFKVSGVCSPDAAAVMKAALEHTDTVASTGMSDSGIENDKHGQTKEFRQVLASQSPQVIREAVWRIVKQEHPDSLVLRFLRARKWDIDGALIMFISAVNWRTNMKLDELMYHGEEGFVHDETKATGNEKKVATDFMIQQRMGKAFIHGIDRKGRPISVVNVRMHKIGAQSSESTEKLIVHFIETARLTLQAPVETATIVFDMTGFTLANMDYHPLKFIIQCFEANYPECLGVILIHKAPWIFQGIWRLVRGWLDPVVAAKVQFTSCRAHLEKFIEPGRMPKCLGGDEEWEHRYIEPVLGENGKMKDTAARDCLLVERAELCTSYEKATEAWIRAYDDPEEASRAKDERDEVAKKLNNIYWKLDPYVRARSLYDRTGVIRGNGSIDWYGGLGEEK